MLSRLTQLSELRLRARQLPPGCLPGAINERLTQLRSLVLNTSTPYCDLGTFSLSALCALTRLVSYGNCPLWLCVFACLAILVGSAAGHRPHGCLQEACQANPASSTSVPDANR